MLASGPVRYVLLGLVLAACGSKSGFDAKACAQYKDVYLGSCVDTCTAKSVDRSFCSTKCAEALPKDATYGAKCVASSGVPSSSP